MLVAQYNEVGADSIDIHGIKKMIEDVTKRDDISIQDAEIFLKGVVGEEKEMKNSSLVAFLGQSSMSPHDNTRNRGF